MTRTLYQSYPHVQLPNRQWPNHHITQSPSWCSLDLYLGKQSVLSPMDINGQLEMFNTLVQLGFKQISISNPADSDSDEAFLNRLINEELIPEDVCLQITFACDPHVVEKSVPLLSAVKNLTLQIEVPVSESFCKIIHEIHPKDLPERIERTIQTLKTQVAEHLNHAHVQYSIIFEDFMAVPMPHVVTMANKAFEQFQPINQPLIVHLPNTVDYGSPSYYADGIEVFIDQYHYSEQSIISLFSKNNRGNASACVESGLQAGGQRVEGTLLGIGERAGNNDLLTLILNLQSMNVDTGIDIKDLNALTQTIANCTKTQIPLRHPYCGELSFTALSSYQQKIISAGLQEYEDSTNKVWQVPYFNLNPTDVGRVFERVRYQSAGENQDKLVQTLVSHYGFELPKLLAAEYSAMVKHSYGETANELSPSTLRDIFMEAYARNKSPVELVSINFEKPSIDGEDEKIRCKAHVKYNGESHKIRGEGNGVIETITHALKEHLHIQVDVANFNQHGLTQGSSALAATYIKVICKDSRGHWGVGLDSDSTLSGIKAFFNALNRSLAST